MRAEKELVNRIISMASVFIGDDIRLRCRQTKYVIARICVASNLCKYTNLTMVEIASELQVSHCSITYYNSVIRRGTNYGRYQTMMYDLNELIKREIKTFNKQIKENV